MTSWLELLGLGASVLTTGAFAPQLWKILRTRSGGDVSVVTYLLLAAGSAMWLAYGFLLQAWPLVIAQAITCLLAVGILVARQRVRPRP